MNGIYRYILGLSACLIVLGGCRQLDVNEYENDPGLYFFKGSNSLKGGGQADSVSHSFFLLPGLQTLDTIWIDVRIMGLPSDEARPIKIVQTNVGGWKAAVSGVHYVGFDDVALSERMEMPAGAVAYLMPVVLRKDPSIESDTVRLEMSIVANDYFRPGIEEQIHFMVATTAAAVKPARWSTWQRAFGAWGPQKMWFIMTYLGITDFDDTSGFANDMAYYSYLQAMAKEELERYYENPENPKLVEPDGTEVKF